MRDFRRKLAFWLTKLSTKIYPMKWAVEDMEKSFKEIEEGQYLAQQIAKKKFQASMTKRKYDTN